MNPFLRRIGLVVAIIAASAILHPATAQTPAARFVDSARTEIARAVQAMDADELGQVVTLLNRALVAFPNDPYLLHYRGYAAYWLAVGSVMGGKKDQALPFVTQALGDLKGAESLGWPETVQLEASLNGIHISIEPGLGPTLGPLSGRLAAEAARMGPANPRVFLLQAWQAEGTPRSMGGGAARARELVMKALALFDNDHPAPLAPDWGRTQAESMARRLAP
ncbi:MAG TPA: hypothetical protein VGP84_23265 [Gemmatimonadaceae bacterium]|jgi:hypothetical protein|nr:hypothetical protein [Gemmatimonadaceae bacterium]